MKAEGRNDLAERTKAFALAVIRMTDDLQRTTSSIVLGKAEMFTALIYLVGTSTGAPLSFTKNTTNFAGLVWLAFRPTT